MFGSFNLDILCYLMLHGNCYLMLSEYLKLTCDLCCLSYLVLVCKLIVLVLLSSFNFFSFQLLSASSALRWSSQLSSCALRMSWARSCASPLMQCNLFATENVGETGWTKDKWPPLLPASLEMLLGLLAARRFCATNLALESCNCIVGAQDDLRT